MARITKVPDKIANEHGLKPKQRAFVDALLQYGGSFEKAALACGYTGKNPSARGAALWRSNGVQEAYKAAIWDKLNRGASVAINSLLYLAENAESEHAKIMAAKEVLSRAGFNEPIKQSTGGVTINLNLGSSSDQSATKPIDVTAESVDITELAEPKQGDAPSY